MITYQQSDEKELQNILSKLDHETCVRFALVCAEDVYEVQPHPDANFCIRLVRKWLSSNEKERKNLISQLRHAAYAAWANDVDYFAVFSNSIWDSCYVAAYATVCATDTYYVNYFWAATTVATYASRVTNSYDEYTQLAKSLLSKTTINTKGTNQDLIVLLDFLEDHGEDLIIRNNQGTFINFPEKHIKSSDKSLNNFEVVEAILNDKRKRQILAYINNMYK